MNNSGRRAVGRRGFILGAAAWCTSTATAFAEDGSASIERIWSGFLGTDDPPTLLTLRIANSATAELTVVGVGSIPVSKYQAIGRRIDFETSAPKLRFEGERNAAGDIIGVIRRGEAIVPLTFVRGDLFTERPMAKLPPGPITRDRLRGLRMTAGCPAMGVAWRRGDERVRVLVDGRRSVLDAVPVQQADRWHLGSVTKNMTATLAARLVEQGRIGWHTTIHEIFGGRVPDMQAGYRDLTLLHVLSHHGGLARDTPVEAYANYPPELQRIAYVQAALKQSPIGVAGREMVYSNGDYVVAGLMLETVGGTTWEALIAKHVFDPLGVQSFGFGPPGAPRELDQPQGHRMGARGLEPVRSDVPFAMGPAGRVNMSLGDLATYLCAHRDRPPDFLRPESWDVLHSPPFGGNYALGWEVSKGGVLSHGGTNSWWKSEVRVDPGQRLVCAAVTNVLSVNGQEALLQLEDSATLS